MTLQGGLTAPVSVATKAGCAVPRGGSRLEVVAVYVSSDFVQDRRREDGGELGASAGISYAGAISARWMPEILRETAPPIDTIHDFGIKAGTVADCRGMALLQDVGGQIAAGRVRA